MSTLIYASQLGSCLTHETCAITGLIDEWRATDHTRYSTTRRCEAVSVAERMRMTYFMPSKRSLDTWCYETSDGR